MSIVTNFILTTSSSDEGISAFDKACKARFGHTFVRVDDHAGGSKCIEGDVYLLALNYADDEALVEIFKNTQWQDEQQCQLFIKEQDDDIYRMVGALK